MKISKWAYSIEEGPIEPVYVYEAPVRFWHWAQCAAFFMLVITGFLIGWPPIANYATTWDTYFFETSSCCTWYAACCSPC